MKLVRNSDFVKSTIIDTKAATPIFLFDQYDLASKGANIVPNNACFQDVSNQILYLFLLVMQVPIGP